MAKLAIILKLYWNNIIEYSNVLKKNVVKSV